MSRHRVGPKADLNWTMFDLPRSCSSCQAPLPPRGDHLCELCSLDIEPLDPKDFGTQDIHALYRYQGSLAKLLSQLKYSGRLGAARLLGELLWKAPGSPLRCAPGPTEISAMPLHFLKRWRRGFNQSELILHWCAHAARREGQALTIWPRSRLRRIRPTATQKNLGRRERFSNVEGAFRGHRLERLPKDRPLWVVDDVTTTGATLQAALQCLRAQGFEQSRGLALLKADELAPPSEGL